MPTPIPTTYQLYLDPLLGFTPGGTSWADQSVNENDFTFNNTNYVYENTIGSFTFPVASATIANENIQPGSIPIGTSAITIICWVKLVGVDPATDTYSFFNIGRSPSGTTELISFGVEGADFGSGNLRNLRVFNRAGNKTSIAAADAIPTDYWTMVSYTKPSSGTVADQKLYIDQNEATSYNTVNGGNLVNTSLAAGSDPRVRINNLASPISSSTEFSLGEIWIYNQELSAADISNFYEVTQPRYFPAPPAPQLTLELDATNASSYPGTGSTWFDLTANNNDLTLYGGTTWGNIDSVKSFDFNGTDSYAWNNNVSIGCTNNFTIDSWIKINGTKTDQFITCLGQAAINSFPLFAYNVTGISSGIYGEMGGGTAFTTMIASPTLDTWYNLTMTADGTNVKYYVDGTLQSTVSQGAGSIPASSVELSIGNHVPSPSFPSWFDGNVGYYAVYDGAIGSTQIATNYSTNLPKFTPSPPVDKSDGRSFQQGFSG